MHRVSQAHRTSAEPQVANSTIAAFLAKRSHIVPLRLCRLPHQSKRLTKAVTANHFRRNAEGKANLWPRPVLRKKEPGSFAACVHVPSNAKRQRRHGSPTAGNTITICTSGAFKPCLSRSAANLPNTHGPNTSFKRSAHGRPPGPGCGSPHFPQPGPGALPRSPA